MLEYLRHGAHSYWNLGRVSLLWWTWVPSADVDWGVGGVVVMKVPSHSISLLWRVWPQLKCGWGWYDERCPMFPFPGLVMLVGGYFCRVAGNVGDESLDRLPAGKEQGAGPPDMYIYAVPPTNRWAGWGEVGYFCWCIVPLVEYFLCCFPVGYTSGGFKGEACCEVPRC